MPDREKILILSYFFPPCNVTPSERIFSWASYLHKGNYYPIIVTRNWDFPQKNSSTDIFQSSGTELIIKKFEHYEVHYLPYKNSLKEKLFIRLYGHALYPLYLIFTFFHSFLILPFQRLSSCYFMHAYAKQLLKQQTTPIKKLVVSVAPFDLLGIANSLAKQFGLLWLADYRDDWSTNEMQYADNLPKKILKQYNRLFEKNWLKSASGFLTVSAHYKNKLTHLLGINGYVLENGYMPENFTLNVPLYKDFTIAYLGSIYASQPIEFFLTAYKKFIDANKPNTKLLFIGLRNEIPVRKRIEKAMAGYEQYLEFTERIPKADAIRCQAQAHLLLASAYSNAKGIPGSKLYDYIALNKKVLLCPTDHDILEQTLTNTGQLLACATSHDIVQHLQHYYTLFEQQQFPNPTGKENEKIIQYSREHQTNVLIDALNNL